ncbi:flagellar hook-associated protein FlgK [Clostridium sp. DJ247]|uniref:flagellar hook-associated protein FlgK n=1 Tax=Clostridium sp. DJ247 TaxID=2726188 RepID=UPI00162A7FE1|nr:flagellar hook-associated protein FlgK [Clostridium sp. DJ247]MBC2582576.1 flagellar hook-associated protein FlgK [Clostridium sp. DJ247]
MSGLFGTFNIATRGLFAQQRAIDVTSHNIANANTEGYSRQRVTLQTTRPQSVPGAAGQIGTGVDVASIDRIRDSFLDYQVRFEMAVDGQFKGRDKFLSQVENIINEPTDTGLSTLIGKFFDSWNTLATSADKSNAKSVVAQQSLALTNELNHSYTELESLKSNTQTVIKDTIFDINGMIGQINQLNQQIKQVKISGNKPNDLMDRRDLLIDQLSTKFGLTISKRDFDGYDVTTSNEAKYASTGDNGNAPLAQDGKTPLNIVQSIDPNSTTRFSYVSSITNDAGEEKFTGEGTYTVTYYKNGDMTTDNNKVTIKVNIKNTGAPGDANYVSAEDKFKQLNQCRVLWANNNGVALKVKDKVDDKDSSKIYKQIDTNLQDGSNLGNNQSCDFENLALFKAPTGELKGYMSVQQDIDTYQNQLNKFAKALAFSVNGIMSQSASFRADYSTDGEGGINNLFVNSKSTSSENGITAENITVNADILKDDGYMKIKTATSYDINGNATSGESDGTRALAIASLRDKLIKIQDINASSSRADFLTPILKQDSNKNNLYVINNDVGGMTLDSYFKDTVDRLGIQEQEARRMVDNQAKLLAGFKESRDSVSGVSLDEEMANLIQFQHCYQANAKIISTVDQLLDVIINGLKR